jgi:hypothetical protein
VTAICTMIPNDGLTRKLLIQVLARMVLFDLEREQEGTADLGELGGQTQDGGADTYSQGE